MRTRATTCETCGTQRTIPQCDNCGKDLPTPDDVAFTAAHGERYGMTPTLTLCADCAGKPVVLTTLPTGDATPPKAQALHSVM